MTDEIVSLEEMLEAAFFALEKGATLKEVLEQMFRAGETAGRKS